ncbi:MAG: alpha-2-macroglobulin [Pseudomonadota bacterium]
MARSTAGIAIGAAVAAFALGLVLGRNIDRGDAEISDSAGNSLVAPATRRTEETPRQPFQQVRASDAPRAVDAPAGEGEAVFAYERLTIETGGAAPQACFRFNAPLITDGSVAYADYVRLSPNAEIAASANGRTLCLMGLQFNREYAATLRAGLPGADGALLARAERVTIAFGDKPAYVGFAGEGIILPRLDADGLAIETVNVDAVEISIARVSDRSLVTKSVASGGAISENDYYYAYGAEDGGDVGVPVFKEKIAVDGARNDQATTVFPIGAALNALQPGAYFVRIQDASPSADRNRPAQAWRWVLYTDIALTTYSSSEGLTVAARSLQSGRPKQGVDLQLLAVNNDILARTTTDADGFASFGKAVVSGDGPLRPGMVMAYGPQADFAAIDLRRAPLDLSDRNIGGRAAAAVIDGFVYLDRGVYRPGETVRLTSLLRGPAGEAMDRKATLAIRRPNGVEAKRFRISELQIGGFARDYELPKSAPRGTWRVIVEADGGGVVAEKTFSVEDFVPQRLEVALEMDETTPIRPGEDRPIGVKARYLYGAPAKSLAVEAEARLKVDPNPFPAYQRFRFARVRETFRERFVDIDAGEPTDGEGEAALNLKIDAVNNPSSAPLRAEVVVGVVEPGGRVVRESARLPLRELDRYVGLALKDGARRVGEGAPAEIDLISLTRGGAPAATELEWSLVEEDYWFEWYRSGGQWRWRRSYRDVPVSEGRVTTGADGLASIAERLPAGSYRLAVADPGSGASAELQFYVGWRSYGAGVDRPDQAALTLLNEKVTPGARARLKIDAPYAGEAVIVVATDKVQSVQRLRVEPGARDITIDTDESWGAGFYVLATIVTPRDAAERPVPRRAMGVAYAPFDMSERILNVAFTAPDVARPRAQLPMRVSIDGADRGEDVMLTVAAVDEGILRLTKFASPDPVGHYFGKKRLGVEVRDDYGRVLDPNLGAPARFGGDQIGGEGLTVVPTKSVALYSGLVTVDDEGRATVPLDLPDFNGELRLMAVAWSATKLGAGSEPLTVRDPVPALLSLPRFLAPGDTAAATLLIDNVAGAAGDYVTRLSGSGAIAASTRETISLASGEQAQRTYEVEGGTAGLGAATLSVRGPNDLFIAREYPIQTRTPYFPTSRVTTRRLAAGETLNVDATLIDGLVEGTVEATASFSPLRGVAPGPLLESLYRYPYGCSEQLVSTAFPLIYWRDVAAAAGRDDDLASRGRVQDAVNKLLDRQGTDGAFGLWRVDDRGATPWLGAYVTDFLAQASEEGYAVPESSLELAYRAMAKIADYARFSYVAYRPRAYEAPWSNDSTEQFRLRAAAYATYVLARAGRADLSDARYLHDAQLERIESPLARAHLGAALGWMGDRARALNAFEKARAAIGFDNSGDYYQTPLRDAAGVLALLAEMQGAPGVEAATEAFVDLMRAPDRLQTQEKAFSLFAANALIRAAGDLAISSADGQTLSGAAPETALSEADIASGAAFTNDGGGPVFASISVSGTPDASPGAYADGYELTKRIAGRDGSAVDLSSVRQNDQLVVLVSGRSLQERINPSIIVDLLPAGFEIEAVLSEADVKDGPYEWIGGVSRFKIAEARDDRFVAAIDLGADRFTAAYLVRAVTPGDFALPGAVIEDMYRPGTSARTEDRRVTIAAAG